MEIYVFGIIAAAVLGAAAYALAAVGMRNGDRAGDARVAGVARSGAQPDEPRPVLAATVRNPSGSPVLAGVVARRARLPAAVAGGMSASAPLLTGRRKFRPDRWHEVGVVPAGGTGELRVPAPARGRLCLLTVAVGQERGRLRVYRMRLAASGRVEPGRGALPSPSLR